MAPGSRLMLLRVGGWGPCVLHPAAMRLALCSMFQGLGTGVDTQGVDNASLPSRPLYPLSGC